VATLNRTHNIIEQSPYKDTYENDIDRESAHKILKARVEKAELESDQVVKN